MRTTIDLPDDLFRRVKATAALSGIKLKDLIARYVDEGLRRSAPPLEGETQASRRRSPLPVIPEATTGKPIRALSNVELAAFELEEDVAKHDRSAGR